MPSARNGLRRMASKRRKVDTIAKMMAAIDEFIDFLIECCESDENTLYAEQLLNDARKAIAEGRGTVASLTSSSINGKSFSKTVHLSPIEVARACQLAIADYKRNAGPVRSTYGNFTRVAW